MCMVYIVNVCCKSIVSVYCECPLRVSIVSVYYSKCLLCFRSKMLKKIMCFIVISFKRNEKSNGFMMCSIKNSEKVFVLLWCRSRMLKKQWIYCVFA